MHGRHGILGSPVPECELRRAEPDALDSASGDQHLLPPGPAVDATRQLPDTCCSLRDVKQKIRRAGVDPPDLPWTRRQPAKVRLVPCGPPASVTWRPPGNSMKAVVWAGTATVSENR